jgi:hypothetical protein
MFAARMLAGNTSLEGALWQQFRFECSSGAFSPALLFLFGDAGTYESGRTTLISDEASAACVVEGRHLQSRPRPIQNPVPKNRLG